MSWLITPWARRPTAASVSSQPSATNLTPAVTEAAIQLVDHCLERLPLDREIARRCDEDMDRFRLRLRQSHRVHSSVGWFYKVPGSGTARVGKLTFHDHGGET
jgi:hypothetical protein